VETPVPIVLHLADKQTPGKERVIKVDRVFEETLKP
jgi:hypothetical protein